MGVFARALERKSVHAPHYKPGLLLCSLGTKDKLILFAQDSFNPAAFLAAGFNAGLDQASDRDPTFRQGAQGYGKRYAATFTDQTSSKFFRDFAYPTFFREDPRYYRMSYGNVGQRLLHAVSHSVIAYHENGNRMFNCSEWLGITTSAVLGNAYHPGNERGVVRSPVLRAVRVHARSRLAPERNDRRAFHRRAQRARLSRRISKWISPDRGSSLFRSPPSSCADFDAACVVRGPDFARSR